MHRSLIPLLLLLLPVVGSSQSVTGFQLINADTDAVIGPLEDGDILDLSLLPTSNLNVEALVSGSVGSVRFGLDGNANFRTESVAPYALAGDSGGNFSAWTPALGVRSLTATPYTETNAGGSAGTALTVEFTVVDGSPPPPPPPPPPGDIPSAVLQTPSAGVYGELQRWHRITIAFEGPATSEGAVPNPFTDYRLDVTFTHPDSGATLVVPGYYAADGAAGETSAASGNIWRVHFAPDRTGVWNYTTRFREGAGVAVSTDPDPGVAAALDGDPDGEVTGSFTVAETDKQIPDNRARGQLRYVGAHYLQWAGTGEYFLKQGPDAPENLLAYADFDGGFKSDGFDDGRIKTWAPHLGDWQPGDPAWQNGKGRALIGALNYLSRVEGLNAFSFLTMNIQGDDKNVFPYTGYTERVRFDVSRLDQWEVIFAHAQSLGLYLHFKTQETENDLLLDNGDLGPQRRLYYRELIARFSHHLALNWNLGEENDVWQERSDPTQSRIKAYAQYFKDLDPYDHNIVIHSYPGQKEQVYGPLLGSASELTGASLQTSNADFRNVHGDTLEWVERSAAGGKPWVVAVDEPGDAQAATRPDSNPGNSHEDGRRRALWGTLLAGGAGNEWYFGYGYPHSDLTCEDFRSRDQWWDYCRHALSFFEDNGVPFWEMTNRNDLIGNAADDNSAGYCFARTGEVYVISRPSGGAVNLDLNGVSGRFAVRWFDPRNGGTLQTGSIGFVDGGSTVSIGEPPAPATEDWIALLRLQPAGRQVLFIRGGSGTVGFLEGGSDEQAADITNYQTFNGNHGWGEFADLLTANGFLPVQMIEGPVSDNTPIPFSSMDLSVYDVIVLGSNNADYTPGGDPAHVDAVEDFVRRGGGLLVISDANFGQDWADASNSDQDFLDRFGLVMNQDRGTYSLFRSEGDFLVADHPILNGVDRFDGEGVTPVTLGTPVPGVTTRVLVRAEGQIRRNTSPSRGVSTAAGPDDGSLVIALAGGGRVACHFDRNTFFNLNGAGTDINRFDNAVYAVNLLEWLAGGADPAEAADTREGFGIFHFNEEDRLDPAVSGDSVNLDGDPFTVGEEYLLGFSPWEYDSGAGVLAPGLESGRFLVTFTVIGEPAPGYLAELRERESLTTGVWEGVPMASLEMEPAGEGRVRYTLEVDPATLPTDTRFWLLDFGIPGL